MGEQNPDGVNDARDPVVGTADPAVVAQDGAGDHVGDESGAGPGEPVVAERGGAFAFLLYNLARLGLFLLALALFYLVGFRGIALIVVALLVSGAVSYVALYRLRGAASASLAHGWKSWNQKMEARASAEDVD